MLRYVHVSLADADWLIEGGRDSYLSLVSHADMLGAKNPRFWKLDNVTVVSAGLSGEVKAIMGKRGEKQRDHRVTTTR